MITPAKSPDMPMVSVIIRTVNRPSLRQALDSVAAQTYSNIEVVLVDAKGTGLDGIGEYCGGFPLCIVGSGCALRRGAAANFGLHAAHGEYLIFLDDDDLFDPGHIASLAAILNDVPDCKAVYAGVRVEDNAGRLLGLYDLLYSAARFMGGNFIPIHAVLFRQTLVAEGCNFDEQLDAYEDWDFWMQVAKRTTFIRTGQISAVYRAQLGESGMSLPVPENLQKQKEARLAIWNKWWPTWTGKDLDGLVGDFREQIAALQQQLGGSASQESDLLRRLAERDACINGLNRSIAELNRSVAELNRSVADRDTHIEGLNCNIAERDGQIVGLYQIIARREEEIAYLRSSMEHLYNSTSWKVTAPLRLISRTLTLALCNARPTTVRRRLKRVYAILRIDGLQGLWLYLKIFFKHRSQLAAPALEAKPGTHIKKRDYQSVSNIDIDKYNHFFLDVFDTAILRLFQRPIDIFEYIALMTGDPNFQARRIRREEDARKAHPHRRDIHISSIYADLPGASIDAELEAETKFCVANPEIHAFYEKLLAAGKKIHFVSDMYLDRETLAGILEDNGYSSYETLYVSSADDLIKGDGSRFGWLGKQVTDSPCKAIHIGDNYIADFIQPRAHGFDALHYMESFAYFEQDPFLYSKIGFLTENHRLGLSFMVSAFRYWKTGRQGNVPSYWEQFGFFYGGALVTAFCGFVKRCLAERHPTCNRVFFLARDGDIMSQVWRLFYNDIEPVYLLASRRCMSLPSMKTLTEADDGEMLKIYTTPIGVAAPADVLERFAYPDLRGLAADLARLKPDTSKWTDSDVLACIQRNRKPILEKIVAEREVLFDYLEHAGFFKQDEIIVADVGWGGTIQDALARLLGIAGYSARRLHGYYLGVNTTAQRKDSKSGYLFTGDQTGFSAFLNLIELITSSPQDGVVRIERADGRFVPYSGRIAKRERQRQAVSVEIQQGILDFARIVKARHIDLLKFTGAEDFKILFTALQQHASQEDADALGGLRHTMTLGNNFAQHVLTKS